MMDGSHVMSGSSHLTNTSPITTQIPIPNISQINPITPKATMPVTALLFSSPDHGSITHNHGLPDFQFPPPPLPVMVYQAPVLWPPSQPMFPTSSFSYHIRAWLILIVSPVFVVVYQPCIPAVATCVYQSIPVYAPGTPENQHLVSQRD